MEAMAKMSHAYVQLYITKMYIGEYKKTSNKKAHQKVIIFLLKNVTHFFK
jgi:hypothetical protein